MNALGGVETSIEDVEDDTEFKDEEEDVDDVSRGAEANVLLADRAGVRDGVDL